MPSVSIIAANKVVEQLRKKERVARGTYHKLTEEQNTEIANCSAVRHFNKRFDMPTKESSGTHLGREVKI